MTLTRVYRRCGRRAHVLRWDDSPNDDHAEALCGEVGPWYGTGTQDEHERAQELPACRRCTEEAAR